MGEKLNEGIKSRIIEYAKSGEKLSDREIARRLGCSQAYVSKTLNKMGIERSVRIKWDLYDFLIGQRLKEGVPMMQIAKEIGIEYATVRSHIIIKGMERAKKNLPKPIRGKIEVGAEVYDDYTERTFYDYTDLFIDRPCMCQVPEWKKQLEKDGVIPKGTFSEDVAYEL